MNSTTILNRLGWTVEPDGRGTLDIIWSCFLVLFVCIWTVLHDNIQSREDSYWTVVIRKLRWSVLAVFAPEMLTLFAIMQWNAANRSVKEMSSFHDPVKWTKTHAFYANAGGFLLSAPGFPPFPINATSIHYLCSHDWMKVPNISEDDIWDRSKADKFAKGVAFIQIGWLLCTVIARTTLGLSVTPLELFTVAFILPTVTTTFYWWSKPQNVTFPTTITVAWPISAVLISAGDAAKNPYVDTPMDFIEKPVWEGWKRRPSLLQFGGLNKRPLSRIPNDYSPPPPTGKEATIIWVISVAHAAIHVLGWSFKFATAADTLIWRVSTVALLIVMITGCLMPVLSTVEWFDFSLDLIWIWIRVAKKETWIRLWLFRIIADGAYIVYILARLIIFAEIFIAFRSLPADAYDDIQWTSFWPHTS